MAYGTWISRILRVEYAPLENDGRCYVTVRRVPVPWLRGNYVPSLSQTVAVFWGTDLFRYLTDAERADPEVQEAILQLDVLEACG